MLQNCSDRNFRSKTLILLLFVFTAIFVCQPKAVAQNDYRSLILSPQSNAHFLSPYLKKYPANANIKSVEDIIYNSSLQSELLSSSSSIIRVGLESDKTWLTFDIVNRSGQDKWYVNFGNVADGRFGIFDDLKIYVSDETNGILQTHLLNEQQNIELILATNQKSQIILEIDKLTDLPVTVPFKLLKENLGATSRTLYFISLFSLIGMVFFFAAVSIVKFNYSYLYFCIYYIALTGLFFVQNNYILFDFLIFGSNIQSYFFFGISVIALIIANLFWYKGDHQYWLKPTFLMPVIVALASIAAAKIFFTDNQLASFFLKIGPSIFIIFLIPLISVLQKEDRKENLYSFTLGWFIFLFGISISILALSDIIQPVSSAINAYWIALIPQAIFFILTARIDFIDGNNNINISSKVLEINESETVSRLRKSKENTEQDRLLKVIQEERKVLSEFRKSEARRTEEMQRAKELADEANRGKSAFLAVVSHEIRTPMTGVMGMVRMLLDSNLTREQNEYAQTILESSDAMLALLNDILDFEKIEQGKMTFENISFDLHRLITGVATLMNGHATQKKLILETNIGENLPKFVMGDPTRMRQVLLNLTGNAVKFTEKGKVTITVELMKENEDGTYEIYFSVADNGIGISEEAKKNLFTPFSQADKSISRKFGGTGLGLAISKGLIGAMDSDINISSTEGEGSTFFFTLTMKPGISSSHTATKARTRIDETITDKKILVIDDNHINRKVIAGILKELPYTLVDFDNAEDGLAALKKDHFDLILMDIELPDMNGDEATTLIRKSFGEKKDITIIALTGNTDREQINAYLKAGVNACLEKPIDPAKLIKTIQNPPEFNFDAKENVADTPLPISNLSLETENTTTPKPPENIPVKPVANEKLEIKPLDQVKPIQDAPVQKPSTPVAKPLTQGEPLLYSAGNQVVGNKTVVTSSMQKKAPQPPKEDPPKKIEGEAVTPIIIKKKRKPKEIDFEILGNLEKHLSRENIVEMVNDVLSKSDEIIDAIKAAHNKKDTKALLQNCHDLKGMGGNFGLEELSDLAKEIEQKSKTQPDIIVSTLINSLPDTKKRAETALLNWCNQA